MVGGGKKESIFTPRSKHLSAFSVSLSHFLGVQVQVLVQRVSLTVFWKLSIPAVSKVREASLALIPNMLLTRVRRGDALLIQKWLKLCMELRDGFPVWFDTRV